MSSMVLWDHGKIEHQGIIAAIQF